MLNAKGLSKKNDFKYKQTIFKGLFFFYFYLGFCMELNDQQLFYGIIR